MDKFPFSPWKELRLPAFHLRGLTRRRRVRCGGEWASFVFVSLLT